ncbi:uncharacterized protein [Dermacentor albipictus]|uniref:uncharacterized protein isoform X2 n=1 Tax=Dermacentor albipictus TaxID=60249 RepID=UPI0031FC85C3
MSEPQRVACSHSGAITSDGETLCTKEGDIGSPNAKSLLSQRRRHVLCEIVNARRCSGSVSEKTFLQGKKPAGCTCDGVKLRKELASSTLSQTNLKAPPAKRLAAIKAKSAQSPEEASNLSIEAMPAKADNSGLPDCLELDPIKVFCETSELREAVADMKVPEVEGSVSPEEASNLSIEAMPAKADNSGLPDCLELDPIKVICETSELREAVADMKVPEVEGSVSHEKNSGDLSMEIMYSKLDISDEVFGQSGDSSLDLTNEAEDNLMSSLAAPNQDRLVEDEFVDPETMEEPVQDQLQYLPLD